MVKRKSLGPNMKKHFPGYYNYTDRELKTIWGKGYFVFDTCVLLNIYYLSSQKKVFLDILDKLKDRIQLPYHIAEEYHKNIFNKINEQYQHFNDIKNKVSQLKTCIQDGSRQGLWDSKEERDTMLEQISSIEIKINKVQNNNLYADLRSKIADLFTPALCDKLPSDLLENIKQEAIQQLSTNSVPGFKDKKKSNGNQYGDFIIWKSLQHIAINKKRPIIFVTEDIKTDWFASINNIHYARPDWINDFILTTQQSILIYTLAQFIDIYSARSKENLTELKSEIKEAQAIRQYENENTKEHSSSNTGNIDDNTGVSDTEG